MAGSPGTVLIITATIKEIIANVTIILDSLRTRNASIGFSHFHTAECTGRRGSWI
jgi:hypothetical protein